MIAFSDTQSDEAASVSSVRKWPHHFKAQYSQENKNTCLFIETGIDMEFISMFFSLETLLILGTYGQISTYTMSEALNTAV